MPPYPYLFKKQKISHGRSADALPVDVGADYEVVPTDEAFALAAYVTSLRQTAYIFDVPPPPAAKPPTMQSKPATQPTIAPAK
jgi:hypothetical protein